MKIKKEDISEIIKKSISIADVLRALNLLPRGSNYKTIKKYIKLYELDTSHFLGQSHLKGKTRINVKIKPLENYLIVDSPLDPSFLKKRLIRENILEYKCNECAITIWNNKNIVLHLDHINGINDDHRLENLRLLCPNCHSQTPTYCGRNAKHKNVRAITNNKCKACLKSIDLYSTYCRKCVATHDPNCIKTHATKINWLPTDQLIKLVDELGYVGVGKQLGVSGNAIKKRIRNHPLTNLSLSIDTVQ